MPNLQTGWVHDIHSSNDHVLKFYVEITNLSVGTQARNVTLLAELPARNVDQPLRTRLAIHAANSDTDAQDAVTISLGDWSGRAKLQYVPGSSRLTWDENGDGSLDFNSTPFPDGVAAGGLRIGDLSGGAAFTMQVNFLAKVRADDSSPIARAGSSFAAFLQSPSWGGISAITALLVLAGGAAKFAGTRLHRRRPKG